MRLLCAMLNFLQFLKMTKQRLKKNIMRFGRITSAISSSCDSIQSIRQWQSPTASILFFLVRVDFPLLSCSFVSSWQARIKCRDGWLFILYLPDFKDQPVHYHCLIPFAFFIILRWRLTPYGTECFSSWSSQPVCGNWPWITWRPSKYMDPNQLQLNLLLFTLRFLVKLIEVGFATLAWRSEVIVRMRKSRPATGTNRRAAS